MKKLLIILLLIVGCDEGSNTITEIIHEYNPKHGCIDSQATNYDSTAVIDNNSCEYNMFCALEYEYVAENGEKTTWFQCAENFSEELCIHKATYGCEDWFLAPFSGVTCTSGLKYYISFDAIGTANNCSEWCANWESEEFGRHCNPIYFP